VVVALGGLETVVWPVGADGEITTPVVVGDCVTLVGAIAGDCTLVVCDVVVAEGVSDDGDPTLVVVGEVVAPLGAIAGD